VINQQRVASGGNGVNLNINTLSRSAARGEGCYILKAPGERNICIFNKNEYKIATLCQNEKKNMETRTSTDEDSQVQSGLVHDVWKVIATNLADDAQSIRLLDKRKALQDRSLGIPVQDPLFDKAEKKVKARSTFAASCRLFRRLSHHDDRVFDTLMQHIENGNLVQIKKLFDGKSAEFVIPLLSRERKIASYSNQALKPIQLAFLQCEASICAYFKTLPGAAGLFRSQLQRPLLESTGQAKIPENFFEDILADIVAAIPSKKLPIEKIMLFRASLQSLIKDKFDLINFFNFAIEFYQRRLSLSPPLHRLLFATCVFGSLQFASPAWVLKGFADGINGLILDNQVYRDRFTTKLIESFSRGQDDKNQVSIFFSLSPFLEDFNELGIKRFATTNGVVVKPIEVNWDNCPEFLINAFVLQLFLSRNVLLLSEICFQKVQESTPSLSSSI
jgi:hypothetical protein